MSIQTITRSKELNRIAAGLFGAVFTLLGLLGFTVSGGHDALGSDGGHLLGLFEVNVSHNLVHLAVGVVLIAAAVAGEVIARFANIAVGVVYLLVGVVGLAIIGTDLNLIALNGLDNGLHIVVGGAMAAAGVILGRKTAE